MTFETTAGRLITKDRLIAALLALLTFLVYFQSNPTPQSYYDYTYRVAENILRGAIGFVEKPPSWLNEFVPYGGFWYSVFPFGSVVTMMPFSLLRIAGAVDEMPASFIPAFCAAVICIFLWLIASRYEVTLPKRVLVTAGVLFGTFTWTNLAMGGAWQITLGFAMLGQLGSIYYSVYKPRPLIAGMFFAMAFGNRTEVLLTAPVMFYLLARSVSDNCEKFRRVILFCAAPFVLGVLTLVYNYVRFESPFDFGHARIPGVLDEPWYRYGIFSFYYIPLNLKEMMWTPWRISNDFPYLLPSGFGNAIWWSSPFLLFVLRRGCRDFALVIASWTAVIILTLLLWTHGNPGGWQFGYRYAMILLPWFFVILLENDRGETKWYEWPAYLVAFALNGWATYLFFWTQYIKP